MPVPVLPRYLSRARSLQSQPARHLQHVMILASWWYLYRTLRLKIRCVGENPDGAYARGIDPDRVQLFYAVPAVCSSALRGLPSPCASSRAGPAPGVRGIG